VGSDPRSCERRLFRDCIWVSTAGAGEGESAGPIINSGRVTKNRTVLTIPEREKRVLVKRVIWDLTWEPEKKSQRAIL
jgi:hypothetical protein